MLNLAVYKEGVLRYGLFFTLIQLHPVNTVRSGRAPEIYQISIMYHFFARKITQCETE